MVGCTRKSLKVLSFLILLAGLRAWSAESTISNSSSALEPSSSSGPLSSNRLHRPEEDDAQEVFEEDYAMKGYSFGLTASAQRFEIAAAMVLADGTHVDLSSTSADFEYVGAVLRYAILPMNKVGADISLTGGASINNESLGFSPITFGKAVVSLGYAIPFSANNSLYFLLGGGYEYMAGTDIQKIMKAGGGTYQIGAGLAFGRNFNVEGYFAYSEHGLSDDYVANFGEKAIQQGATGYSQDGKAAVKSASLIGRISYGF